MELRLRFPMLHALQFLLGLLGLVSFFATISFLVAVPVVHGTVGTASVPVSWEAAVRDHGKYYQWYLIDNHLVLFSASVAALVFCCVASAVLAKAHKVSQQADKLHGPVAYKVADAAIFVAGVAIVFLFMHMYRL